MLPAKDYGIVKRKMNDRGLWKLSDEAMEEEPQRV